MAAYTPDAWDSFFVAGAGASAALAGLLFVGISISISLIAGSPRLVRRSLEAFVLLAEVLLLSALALVPGVGRVPLGLGLAGIALGAWLLVAAIHRATLRARATQAAGIPAISVPVQIALAQAATLTFVVGAVTLAVRGGGGLYWFAPGVIFAFAAALTDAWVLLVEIQR